MYFKSGFIALLAPAFIFSNSRANSFAALSSAALVAPFANPTPSWPVSVKDVKADGTAGGTATSGSFATRDLNTVEGDDDIVSLSSNQITLTPGTYDIWACVPTHRANTVQTRLRNTTDSTDAIIGTSAYSDPSAGIANVYSFIVGHLVLTSPKTFEVQMEVQTTRAGDGFGQESSVTGQSEVYTQVVVRKLK